MKTTPKKNGGFTLVELIVVIAILAILAAVAIPAYSGYITKAEKANDLQLLGAVNTAFNAACVENGVSILDMEGAIMNTNADKKLATLDISKTVAYAEANVSLSNGAAGVTKGETLESAIFESFKLYFAGNLETPFKFFTQLVFKNGAFEGAEGELVSIGGNQIFVSKELADALKNNNFSALGAAVLTGKVDKVSDIASGLVFYDDDAGNPSVFKQMIFGEGSTYLEDLAESLDVDLGQLDALMTNADGSLNTDFLANSLVLTAAQKTNGMDTSFLGVTGSASQLRRELDNPETATDAMAKLALTYGMYTSYVQTNPEMEDKSEELLAQGTFSGMTGILEDIESEDFRKYLASAQGQADLNAYMASMQIVTDSANQSSDATKDLLTNGFTNTELVGALDGLLNPSAE